MTQTREKQSADEIATPAALYSVYIPLQSCLTFDGEPIRLLIGENLRFRDEDEGRFIYSVTYDGAQLFRCNEGHPHASRIKFLHNGCPGKEYISETFRLFDFQWRIIEEIVGFLVLGWMDRFLDKGALIVQIYTLRADKSDFSIELALEDAYMIDPKEKKLGSRLIEQRGGRKIVLCPASGCQP